MKHLERAKAHWELTRIEGKTRFAVTRGVLGWGVPMTAVMLSRDYLIGELSLVGALSACVLFPAGGYLFGRILWVLNERGYRR